MRREDIEKLLGGYASDTLTGAERKALFDAALTDQALFDRLADDQALKEVFDDPACRARLAAALDSQPKGFIAWLRRPSAWALTGSLAGTVVIAVVLTRSALPPPPAQSGAASGPAFSPRQNKEAAIDATSKPLMPSGGAGFSPRQNKELAAAPIRATSKPPVPSGSSPHQTQESAPPGRSKGGAVGGVIGGIFRSTTPPPESPAAVAESKATLPAAPALPPPPETAPPAQAEAFMVQPRAAMATRFAAAEQTSSDAALNLPPLLCTVQRRTPAGAYLDVPPGAEMLAGDSIRLLVEAAPKGYLYVLWRPASGAWRLLFPAPGGANYIASGQRKAVPDGDFRFDGQLGEIRVLLVLTAAPEPAFETGPIEPLLARLRGEGSARDVLPQAAMTATRDVAAKPHAIMKELPLRFR